MTTRPVIKSINDSLDLVNKDGSFMDTFIKKDNIS